MKCPKCNVVTFDHLSKCPRCQTTFELARRLTRARRDPRRRIVLNAGNPTSTTRDAAPGTAADPPTAAPQRQETTVASPAEPVAPRRARRTHDAPSLRDLVRAEAAASASDAAAIATDTRPLSSKDGGARLAAARAAAGGNASLPELTSTPRITPAPETTSTPELTSTQEPASAPETAAPRLTLPTSAAAPEPIEPVADEPTDGAADAANDAQALDSARLKARMVHASQARRKKRPDLKTETVDPALPDWYEPAVDSARPRPATATSRKR